MASFTNPSHGTLANLGNGQFTYTANGDYVGTDSFTYTISDGQRESLPAEVTIDVLGHQPYVDNPNAEYGLANFYDNRQEALGGHPALTTRPITYQIITPPRHGLVTIDQSTGYFHYEAGADFVDVDSFNFVVTDGVETSAAASVTIGALSYGQAPQTAVTDQVPTFGEGYGHWTQAAALWPVDTSGNSPIQVLNGPSHGTIQRLTVTPANGPPTTDEEYYVPSDDFAGTDYITVRDTSQPNSNPYVIELDVVIPADPTFPPGTPVPTTAPDYFYPFLEATNVFNVARTGVTSFSAAQSNFTDVQVGWRHYTDFDQETVPVSLGQQATHGLVALQSDGSFTYTPTDDDAVHGPYVGVDYFSYKVGLPSGGELEQWVELKVGNNGVRWNADPPTSASANEASPAGDPSENWQPETFSNNLKGLWQQYMAAKDRLGDVIKSINTFGQSVSDLQALPDPTTDDQETAVSNALDTSLARLDDVTSAYNRYIRQAAAAHKAAGNYMRDVWYFSQADGDVISAIASLPRDVAGISPDRKQMLKRENGLSQYQNGADFAVANSTYVVTAARETHDALETALQAGGLASIAVSGAELLTKEGCEAFAKWTAKQIVNTAAAVGVSAAFQGVKNLAQQWGIPSDYLAIGTDSLQVFFLIKAARAQQKAAGANCFAAGTLVAAAVGGDPIEDVHLGQRVLTQVFASGSGEPTNAAGDPNSTSFAPSTWREVDLDMSDGSGGDYTMQLLEPLSWISQNRAATGSRVYLDLRELQINGEAEVLSIKACPTIAAGQGRVVLGTFQHLSNDLVDVKLVGDASLLRVTSGHMLWSVDRDEWVNAGELQPGEQMATESGIAIVQSVTTETRSAEVYNLDVETGHRYFAGDDKVLAHNANPCPPGRTLTDIVGDDKVFMKWLRRPHPIDVPLSQSDARLVWDKMVGMGLNPRFDATGSTGIWTGPHFNVSGMSVHIPVVSGFTP